MEKSHSSVSTKKCTLIVIVVAITFVIFSTLFEIIHSVMVTPDTMKMAFILFRHGEKNPTSFYPKDPHQQNLDRFVGGLGALTQKGSYQAYNLGVNLRKRYLPILPENGIYSQKDINVLSSYAERCIMSAQSLFAGLLPVSSKEFGLPIPWQPIPVTSIPRLSDALIAQRKPCLKYDAMLKGIYANPPDDLKELNAANIDLYEKLTTYTGKNISSVLDVELLYNTLKAEEDIGLQLPVWAKDIYPDKLRPLAERSYTVFTDNEYMKTLKGGVFLQEVQHKMSQKAENALNPNRNLFIYAGHDVTLLNVMNSMGIINQTSALPDYASALVFELHQPVNDNYVVQMVYYENSETEMPIPISVPNCPKPCVLEQFKASLAHLLTDDWDDLCANPKTDC